ncbi:Mutanase, partial [Lasiodiplodia theobromae]
LVPTDDLYVTRWNEILQFGTRFVEIVSWNDYGESHYIGPLASKHYDDGNSKWTNDMPHNGWSTLAAPFIAAYKAGATSVSASHVSATGGDKLVYWYRPQPKGLNCASTDNVGSAPAGADLVADSVFVAALLTSGATIEVTSGGNGVKTAEAGAGVSVFEFPLGTGKQSFALKRGGQTVLSGASPKELPASATVDKLGPDGLSRFTDGLKVATCSPTPTLV